MINSDKIQDLTSKTALEITDAGAKIVKKMDFDKELVPFIFSSACLQVALIGLKTQEVSNQTIDTMVRLILGSIDNEFDWSKYDC